MTDHMIEIQKQTSLLFNALNLTDLSKFARLNSVLYRYLLLSSLQKLPIFYHFTAQV